MSNTFVNPTEVAREAVRHLKNSTVMGNLMFRGHEREYQRTSNGYKPGASVTVKAPHYFRVKDGATVDAVELLEKSTTFTVNLRKHVAWPVTAQEMTLNIDRYSQEFLKPAMQALGNYIDTKCLGLYQGIANQVGTPGTTPADFYTFAEAGAVLSDHAVPQEDRACVIDPWAQAKLADNLKGLFSQSMVDATVKKGSLGAQLSGFDMYMSQNVNTHTCGTGAGLTDLLVDDAGVGEGDTTITFDQNGSLTAVLNKGDIFTVAAVNGVNPISGTSTGRLRQFVVEAQTSAAGNDYAISCSPGVAPYEIYSSSATENYLPYQTVDTLPADDAAITVAGSASLSHKVNLAFHKNAMGLVMVPLEIPASVNWSARESYDGYNIRVIRYYDGANDQEMIRFDVLFGLKVLNPFMGCRIAG